MGKENINVYFALREILALRKSKSIALTFASMAALSYPKFTLT